MTTQAVVITPGTDPFAWVRPLRPGVTDAAQPAPYHRFTLRVPMRGESAPFLPLARGRHVSFYVNAYEPGMGERNLHAHDDDASWTVLAGEVTFWTEDEREVAHLKAHQGLFIPEGVPYRYQNTGDGLLLMARGAARREPMPELADFPVGTRPGGTEGISWRRDLWSGVTDDQHPEPFQRFDVRFPLRGEGFLPWQTVVRSEHLALHVSSLEPGKGEVNLHSHDDEAVWVVLHGQVTFYGWEENREIGVLRADDGILIPRDAHYRYENTGDGYLIMLRYGARAEAPPPLPNA